MYTQIIAALAFLTFLSHSHAADPVAAKLSKGKLGNSVAAFDLGKPGLAWEIMPCSAVNFVKPTSSGILVGCEESIVLMVNSQTGKELWRRDLSNDVPGGVSGRDRAGKKFDVNKFHAEKPEGFLLSSDGEDYFLVGKDGRYLIRCDQSCGNILESAPLYGGRLIMRWQRPGSSRGVAAFDIAAGGVAWEMSSCRTANFATVSAAGVVVGCDDASLILLDAGHGKEIWRRDLSTAEPDETRRAKLRINRFHAETPDGFLVSSADVVYMFVSRKGDYLMRCDQEGCNRSPQGARENQGKAP